VSYATGDVHRVLWNAASARLRAEDRGLQGGARGWVAIIPALVWFYGSLAILLLLPLSTPLTVAATISLGLAATANLTVVQHTALHQALARARWVNWTVAFVGAPIGFSHRWWTAKHNGGHHAYTNVLGLDGDISQGGVLRLSDQQPLRPWHRYQHLYVWALYPLLVAAMVLGDHEFIVSGSLKGRRVAAPSASRTLRLSIEKLALPGIILAVAFATHPAANVLAVVAGMYLVAGVALAGVLAVTHYVETMVCPVPDGAGEITEEWAVTQVRAATNVTIRNPVLGWYFGGLNQHVEHHLFPRVAHVHLPVIAPAVRASCEELGLPYHQLPSLGAAYASHYRLLRRLGREATATRRREAVATT